MGCSTWFTIGTVHPRRGIHRTHGQSRSRRHTLKTPLFGAFSSPKHKHMLGAIQHMDLPMRRYKKDEQVDFCIVGVGSAGGVLLQRLARAGFSVVGLKPGRSGIPSAIGLAMRRAPTICIGTSCALQVGRIRWRWAPTIAVEASGVVQFTGLDSLHACILRIFGFTPKTVLVWTGRSLIRT